MADTNTRHSIPPVPGEGASRPVEIELLAPARDAITAIAAVNHGADAVYMGASTHGARHQAANTLEDVARVVDYAHLFGARVYVTVNTIVYEHEIPMVERLVWDLWRIGVDALIVQDMSLLRMHLPPIALHASTQCDIRSPHKAAMLQAAGFSQLVLPRELTLDEIRDFRKAVSVPLEAFVHGALCVSYSGDCQASFALTGRSANRGECAQVCRYSFDLEDAHGNKIMRGKHLLSLKDMNRIDLLADMIEAGITSFKIEGRLKDAGYVKNVVAAYSKALDRICRDSHGRYRRSSLGVASHSFSPQLHKSFNRGFTSYFLTSATPAASALASFDTPKWIGEEVGVVRSCRDARTIIADISAELHNGDGLGYFNSEGVFAGFRLNRIEGNKLFAASEVNVRRGTKLYRNSDTEWDRTLARSEGNRKIPVDMTLRDAGDRIVLKVEEPVTGFTVEHTAECPSLQARTPQEQPRQRVLAKLGDTIYSLRKLTDGLGNMRFVPSSLLARLRRDALDTFTCSRIAARPVDIRKAPDEAALSAIQLPGLTRHDNIANSLAAEFYRNILPRDCAEMPRAVEVMTSGGYMADTRVMQTRYCLRRELGACLRTPNGSKLPPQLFLTTPSARLRLQFDCKNCRMNVFADKTPPRG